MSGIFLRIHLVGLYTNRLPVFRWKARGYDWILVDSIGQPSYGGQYQTTEGFQQAACNGEMQDANSIGFWCHWSSGDGSVIMIGGGGSSCYRADHGIGITEANSPSLVFRYSGEKDFGDEANRYNPISKTYSLNLWLK